MLICGQIGCRILIWINVELALGPVAALGARSGGTSGEAGSGGGLEQVMPRSPCEPLQMANEARQN